MIHLVSFRIPPYTSFLLLSLLLLTLSPFVFHHCVPSTHLYLHMFHLFSLLPSTSLSGSPSFGFLIPSLFAFLPPAAPSILPPALHHPSKWTSLFPFLLSSRLHSQSNTFLPTQPRLCLPSCAVCKTLFIPFFSPCGTLLALSFLPASRSECHAERKVRKGGSKG